MRVMLNDGESATVSCNHVLSGDQVSAHAFTFTNYDGHLYAREFNRPAEQVESTEKADNSDYAAAQQAICEYSKSGAKGVNIRDFWNWTCERLNSSTNCA